MIFGKSPAPQSSGLSHVWGEITVLVRGGFEQATVMRGEFRVQPVLRSVAARPCSRAHVCTMSRAQPPLGTLSAGRGGRDGLCELVKETGRSLPLRTSPTLPLPVPPPPGSPGSQEGLG